MCDGMLEIFYTQTHTEIDLTATTSYSFTSTRNIKQITYTNDAKEKEGHSHWFCKLVICFPFSNLTGTAFAAVQF